MRVLYSLFGILITSFIITGCGGSGDSKSPETGGTAGGAASSETTSSPCEQFMTEYEQLADSYISFMQESKNNPGDMSLITKSADMLKQAADMANRAKDCEGDASMLPRLQKVQAKLQSALQ